MHYVAWIEPFTLMAALAGFTRNIGLVCTATTSYEEPYALARKFASLDLVSEGRAGWNLVTSGNETEAQNFGRVAHPPKSNGIAARASLPKSFSAFGAAGTTTLSSAIGRPAYFSIARRCMCSTITANTSV